MKRTTRHAARSACVVPALVVAAALVACGDKGPEPGGPCTDADPLDVCYDRATMRCTQGVWVVMAECTATCPSDGVLDPLIPHEQSQISADETWTCADGTHVVTGVVNVLPGATLTIEPGARVRIDPSSHIDVDPAGRIVIDAAPFAPAIMTSNNGEQAGFGAATSGGLNVFAVESGEPSVIRNLIIERGIHGLGLFGMSSTTRAPILQNSTFRDNQNFGIKVACAEDDFAIPDFGADCDGSDAPCGNLFFGNGRSDVSACNEDVTQ